MAANLVLCLALGLVGHMAHIAIPKTKEPVFYTLEFLLNVALPYTVISLAPYLVTKCTTGRKAKSA